MKTLLFVSLFLIPGAAAAQCEISRISLPNGPLRLGTFEGNRITLVDGSYSVLSLEPGAGGWAQTDAFTPPGWSLFVSPTAAHRGTLTVSGMEEDANLRGSVFVREGSGPFVTLSASDATGNDAFGSGLALHDDLIVIGASMSVYDVGACGPGKGYVFERTPSGWTETAIFHPHNYGNVVTMYGFQLDTDGSTIVFGAHADDGAAYSAGAVYVYERNSNGWYESAKLVASDSARGYGFGSGVAVQGDQILVGSRSAGAQAEGAVYVFERQAGAWVETQIIRASNGQAGDAFGRDVDMDGDRAVVGASGVDAAYTDSGAIYALERDASGWFETLNVVASDVTQDNARFGRHVRISGNQALWTGHYATEARLTSFGIDNATNDCSSTPNSSGVAAVIQVDGCDSHIANAFTLRASGLPANRAGLFFYGATAVQLPAGNGTLCIGGASRLPASQSDAGGVLELNVDFQSAAAQGISAAQTWRFQAFFRDPGVGFGFDFTDAVELEIQH